MNKIHCEERKPLRKLSKQSVVGMSPKKGCIQICIFIDYSKIMFDYINTTNLENTQLV